MTAVACPQPRSVRLELSQAALFLDLDGTLTPLRARPSDVGREDAVTNTLVRLGELLRGRLAIISGRTIQQVDDIVGRSCLCVAGVHGLQRRNASGEVSAWSPHPRLAEAAVCLQALADARNGLLLESKEQSVALHYRTAPDCAPAVIELATRLADASELELQLGDMVVELKTPGADKGTAMRAFLHEFPFRGASPVFLGDDLADEPAFREAAAHGGFGALVGPSRPTAATHRLADPTAVLAWLAASLENGAFDFAGLPWAG